MTVVACLFGYFTSSFDRCDGHAVYFALDLDLSVTQLLMLSLLLLRDRGGVDVPTQGKKCSGPRVCVEFYYVCFFSLFFFLLLIIVEPFYFNGLM